MARGSSIQWTDDTWNFLTGCTPVSPGCRNCYAAQIAVVRAGNRLPVMQQKFAGTAEMRGLKPHRRAVFTGKVTFHEPTLLKPLSWKNPRRIFVNSMSDLFHESVADEVIDRAFAIMALCSQHTFQVLTKRPERMAEYCKRLLARMRLLDDAAEFMLSAIPEGAPVSIALMKSLRAPLPNVWLGTSVEDQERADERIPDLLRTPAAVRFLSVEPMLGPVDLLVSIRRFHDAEPFDPVFWRGGGVDWVICGGESGHGARPFELQWARDLRDQCAAADVPFFMKQMGSRPWSIRDRITHERNQAKGPDGFYRYLNDSHGGDPDEWPEDLRVREFPREVQHA